MNKRKKSGFGIIIVLCMFGYFCFLVFGQQKILCAKIDELKSLEMSIVEEKSLNEELKRQKENVNSDQYIEKQAREKLGMIKQNEKIFVDINK